ncbi:MAG: DUF2937 family protein [Pseudomonadota bacterium]
MFRKLLITVTALIGMAGGSQLPEFSQQYQQRLGGAIQELEHVVDKFAQDAEAVGMTTSSALQKLEESEHELFQRRGSSMRQHVDRYEVLVYQQAAFDSYAPIARPFAMLNGYDETTLINTWQIYRPAIPLTTEGASWGGAGAVIGWLSMLLPAKLFALLFGPRPRKKSISRLRDPHV